MASTIKARKSGANPKRLNAMQLMFVEELLADEKFNAAAAARRAGYKNPYAKGGALLKVPAIKAMIGKALQERITKCKLTAEAVLEHLRFALFLDPIELFEQKSNGVWAVKNLDDVSEDVRRCITKIKIRTTEKKDELVETYTEIELMSKDAAMVNAMKHLGLTEQGQVNVNIGTVDLRGLLDQVEKSRNVIDGAVISEQARLEDDR